MANRDFEGKIVVITAAGAGIGRACALEFASRGAKLALAELFEDRAAAVVKEIQEMGGQAIASIGDVGTLEGVEALFDKTLKTYGGVDILVNVAGGTIKMGTVEECTEESWRAQIDASLTSVYRCCKRAIPEMRKRGGGAIVNTSSGGGVLAMNSNTAYSSAKAAVNQITKAMAMDFAKDNIRVNCMMPGMIASPRILKLLESNPGHEDLIKTLCPMQRMGEPKELAKAAAFLASDDASYITGVVLPVDGGFVVGKNVDLFSANSKPFQR